MSQQELMDLIKQKDQMQKTIAKLTEEIQEINNIKHFDRDLVDREGFPREDLDFAEVAKYRNLKKRKAELNNDHLKLMKQIQIRLFDYHATLPRVSPQQQEIMLDFSKQKQTISKIEQAKIHQQTFENKKTQKYIIEYLTPFAKITLVEPNSPADLGGIKVNDLLSQFSSINIYTPDNIKQIPHFVKQNQQLKVVAMRPVTQQNKQQYQKVFTLKDKNNYARVDLQLTPQKWSGRGLLGCKIDPL